ncbi:hypothetical protein [Nitrogeniibacter aestuarii]|uniref:hypothetical protein n=1 Tax=Nitrogeniibacter aestuarii TaxID=2815343 RepID=UPI001D123F5A|nr:hypothetical protein [Nitrogeniibacter aestuarii]
MRVTDLATWSATLSFLAALLVLSAGAVRPAGAGEADSDMIVERAVVHDKPGVHAQHIELLERLHRGW